MRSMMRPGALHELDLVVALDRALPVDEPGGVGERGVGKLALEHLEGFRGEPVVVHFHADARLVEAAIGDEAGHVLHGMALGRLDVVVGIAGDVGVGHEGGALGPRAVHAPAPPDRLAFEAQSTPWWT
jgi:hypothetical protein